MQRYSKIRKSWWLFHATDFQSSMYLCFTFCRILGMFPYRINASVIETSKSHYVLSTLVVCTCCIINVIVIRDFITFKISMGTTKIRNLEAVCFFTCSGFITIFAHILSSPRMRLLQTISEISSKLPPKLFRRLSGLIHVKDILGTILIIVQMYKYYSNAMSFNYMNVLTKAFSIYNALLIFHLNMLYINCICVLKLCFKSINDNLRHMQKFAIKDAIRCSPMLIYCMQRNQILLVKLKELEKQHLMVSDAMKMLNLIFSPQLLATTVIIYVMTTFELYYCGVRWQNGSVLVSFDKQLVDMVIWCILYYVNLLTLLVWACETCKNEACKVDTIIHDLFNNIIDEQMKNELQLFSLQAMHCKNIFSAKGVTVNATFFAGVIGTITTYVLILMQFLITLHSCDGKLPK